MAALKEIAEKLVAHCRNGTELDGLQELYADTAESIEAQAMEGTPGRTISGRDGILGKHQWWDENFEVHDASVDGPFLHGDDQFGVIFQLDATHKASGQRSEMKELAIYTVADGKIVREQFYNNG